MIRQDRTHRTDLLSFDSHNVNENITIVQIAEKAVPHNDVVYKLRESMLTASDGENSPALETVIQEEIQARPDDVKLRVRRRLWWCIFFTSL